MAGQAKTRLVPPLSAEGAAALYCGFLLDAVELALSLEWERVSVVHPPDAHGVLRDVLFGDVRLIEQRERGLGAALRQAFADHFAQGFDRVLLIGSDNPTLGTGPVQAACTALERADVSIGPTADGGYYLLGMRQFHAELFEGIEWSTPRVYLQTLEQASRLQLRVEAVEAWFDVDEPGDLERLQAELARSSSLIAPNTRRALSGLAAPAR